MAIRDSGNEQRKLAKSNAEEADRTQAKRDELKLSRVSVSKPPKDAVGTVAWANQVAAALLYEVMNDPVIKMETRWRFASDLIAKIGLTSSKAVAEERILKLEKSMGMAKNQHDDDGLEKDPE